MGKSKAVAAYGKGSSSTKRKRTFPNRDSDGIIFNHHSLLNKRGSQCFEIGTFIVRLQDFAEDFSSWTNAIWQVSNHNLIRKFVPASNKENAGCFVPTDRYTRWLPHLMYDYVAIKSLAEMVHEESPINVILPSLEELRVALMAGNRERNVLGLPFILHYDPSIVTSPIFVDNEDDDGSGSQNSQSEASSESVESYDAGVYYAEPRELYNYMYIYDEQEMAVADEFMGENGDPEVVMDTEQPHVLLSEANPQVDDQYDQELPRYEYDSGNTGDVRDDVDSFLDGIFDGSRDSEVALDIEPSYMLDPEANPYMYDQYTEELPRSSCIYGNGKEIEEADDFLDNFFDGNLNPVVLMDDEESRVVPSEDNLQAYDEFYGWPFPDLANGDVDADLF